MDYPVLQAGSKVWRAQLALDGVMLTVRHIVKTSSPRAQCDGN